MLRVNRWLQTLSLLLLAGGSLVVMLLYMRLGFYAYPAADDFCMVSGVRDQGFFTYLWQHYIEWSGRYSGNALYGLYPLAFGLIEGYAWLATSLIMLFFIAVTWLVATLFRLRLTHPAVLVSALVITCVYLLGLRHTASSLYWLAGALTYQSGIIFLLLKMSVLIRLHDDIRSSRWATPVLIVLIVAGMGTNEINMLVTLMLMLGFTSYAFIQRLPYARIAGLLLVVTLGCFLVVYLAPGNAEREATFPLRHDWQRSIEGSLEMGRWSLLAWVGQPIFFVATLLVPFAAAYLQAKSRRDWRISWLTLTLLALITLFLPIALQFPAWWSMGGWPPPRTVDAIFFVFLCGWIVLIAGLSLRWRPLQRLFDSNGQIHGAAQLALLLMSLLFLTTLPMNSRFQRAWSDLQNHVVPFQLYLQERHTLIRQSRENGQYSLQVPAFDGQFPRSVFFNDIRSDWRDWRNLCYARHFSLNAIQQQRGQTPEQPHRQAPDSYLK